MSKSSTSSTTFLLWMENDELMLKQFIDGDTGHQQQQQQQAFGRPSCMSPLSLLLLLLYVEEGTNHRKLDRERGMLAVWCLERWFYTLQAPLSNRFTALYLQPMWTAVESLGRYYYCLYRSSLSSDLEIRRAAKSEKLPLHPSLVSSSCGIIIKHI